LPKVKVNDIEIYYEVYGEGTPLLMLHGFTISGQAWNNYVADYKPHFQLIIPDYRGHGRTNNPSKHFIRRQAAEDLFALLDYLGINKFKGLGCSTGGDILLHMATKQPKRIEAMALDGAAPYYPKQMRDKISQNIEKIINRIRKWHHLGDDQINLLIKNVHEMINSYDDVNFTKPLLSTIKAKTLIMLGDRDHYFPVEMATILFESIPDSYLWIVPNAGHALTMREEGLVKNVILDFLLDKWEA
jgi:pimeloyl-ACP methyl ester carboxylesterase